MWSGKKITNKEFDIRLSIEYPDIERLTDYINARTVIIFSCKRCKKKFKRKPKEIKKTNCKCLEKENNYKLLIKDKNIELLDIYINIREKIRHLCKICGLEFKTSPKSILNSKKRCLCCSGKIFSINKYKSLLPKNIKLLSNEYIGSNYKHKHICVDCNNEFETKPNYILHMNTNCPFCYKSKGERYIINFLKNKKIDYEKEYIVKINEKNLRFDFYLPFFNILIEYDGVQHFKPVKLFGGDEYYNKLIEYDRLKNEWCIENRIKLIRIPYNENIDKHLNLINE
jgi:hypothetical protein